MAKHPAYAQIVELGEPAIPLILREMQERPFHWFVVLRAITGESPIPPEAAGKYDKMAEAWFAWGRKKGYIS